MRIIDEEKLIYPWLTHHMVYGSLRRFKSNEQCDIQTAPAIARVSVNVTNINGGRPAGSCNKHIQLSLDLKDRANDEMAILYDAEKKRNDGSLKRGSFQKIHQSVIQKFGINDPDFKVNVKSIQSRVYRNSLTVNKSRNQPIPTHDIEKVLLQVSMWKQDASQPISVSEGLDLANSLIDGKPMQNDLKIFQESKKKNPSGILSRRYWQQFMMRHSQQLQAAKGHLAAANRTEWVTFDNINRMYDLVYDQMVAAGVAQRLSPAEHYWVDKHGETIESESDACGLKVEIEITHPEWILFGDEVGTEISQKDDGHVGGKKFVTAKGTRANIKSSYADGRFTAIGLTAASGDPVMAIIIFAAKERSFIQRMGHDVMVVYDEIASVTENSGVGKAFPGGPTCFFCGKQIPALITCSPKGSISSSILRTAFQRLDDLGVYERTPSLKPFALFDAHDSRLQVPFLRYINDPTHQWIFCIGLPNGTHKWQVGDSKEQNGSYKIEWTREKQKLMLWRTRMGLPSVLSKSDILPLFNRVWSKSFARVNPNKKAIRDRGWYPANKMLLTNPEILKTKVADPTSNAIIPADPPPTNTSADLLSTDESLTTASGFGSNSLSTISTEPEKKSKG